MPQRDCKKTYIYGLIDPRNKQLRYVGKANNLKKRLSKHVHDKSINHKTCWIKSLSALNLRPEIIELGEIVKKIEKHYGSPQDIEWAYADSKFYVVQSRPITTL